MYSISIATRTMKQFTLDGVQIVRAYVEDSIRIRDKLTGDITFYGDDFDFLLQQKESDIFELDFSLMIGDEVIYTSKISLNGEWLLIQKKCILPVEQYDQYTDILDGIDRVFRVAPNKPYSTILPVSDINKDETWILWETGDSPSFSISGFTYIGYAASNSDYDEWDEYTTYYPAQMTQDVDETGNTGYFGSTSFRPVYCIIGLTKYRSVTENKNIYPTSPDNDAWIEAGVIYTKKFCRLYSDSGMRFDGSIQWGNFKDWQIGGCTSEAQQFNFEGRDIVDFINNILSIIDPGLTVADIDVPFLQSKDVVLYTDDGISVDFTLEKALNVFYILFNADWRINSGKIEFKEPSQLQQTIKGSYQDYPYQYINRIFSKDWSSEVFTDDLNKAIKREWLEVGKEIREVQDEFSPHTYTYKTPYDTENNFLNSDVEVDIAYASRERSELITALSIDSASGTIKNTIGEYNGLQLYNGDFSLRRLMQICYNSGRPYDKAVLAADTWDYKEDVTLIEAPYFECEIDIPLNRQDLIDFDYLVTTYFGDMYIKSITVDLSSGRSKLKLAKQ